MECQQTSPTAGHGPLPAQQSVLQLRFDRPSVRVQSFKLCELDAGGVVMNLHNWTARVASVFVGWWADFVSKP